MTEFKGSCEEEETFHQSWNISKDECGTQPPLWRNNQQQSFKLTAWDATVSHLKRTRQHELHSKASELQFFGDQTQTHARACQYFHY